MGEDRWEGKRKVEVVVVLDGAVVLVVEETVDKRRWGPGQRITGQEWGLPTLDLLFSQSRTRTGRDWRIMMSTVGCAVGVMLVRKRR